MNESCRVNCNNKNEADFNTRLFFFGKIMIPPLSSLLESLTKTRVLVIGDLMLDHYIWGDVYRISPEAPVPVIHVTRDTFTAGGAANVALNLAGIGVQTSIFGHYTPDEAGKRLARLLTDSGVEILQSQQFSDAPTITKTRVIVRNQQLCRIDREVASQSYGININSGIETMLEEALSNVDAVILSDYAKGFVTQPLVDYLLNVSQQRSELLIAVDPKPSRHLSFRGAGLLTPNRSEALELAGLSELRIDEPYPLDDVCQRIYENFRPRLLVVTLGAEGMAICREGKVVEHLPTEAREVFDVSGAGDTVIAILTAAIASGATPAQAARLANAAAGCVVAHMGTAPIAIEELRSRLF